MKSRLKLLPCLAGPLLFLITLKYYTPEGLPSAGVAVLACTFWIAIWWIFEVVDISITALLPIVLFPITGALDIVSTTASYGHKYIFIYMGGFILAIAIEKWNLHKRIALNIVNFLGTRASFIILGFMIATAFMSMWISNTATSVMMLPIAVAIVLQMKDLMGENSSDATRFSKALLLSIAYSASIGGMATLIGTPPNLVLSGVIKELYNTEISFFQWLMLGLPVSSILLVITWIYLTKYAFKFEQKEFPGGAAHIKRALHDLGKISYEERMVLIIFISTAALWILRKYIQRFIPGIDDSVIAMIAAMAIFLIPSREGKGLLTWNEAVKMPWGIIILFGGGMALALGFKVSGLAGWIGNQFTVFQGLSVITLVVALVVAVNFLTEITSNLATTAMLLPILAPMAVPVDTHPYILLISATMAASCAFMLPVATPPNAVVFGSGYLKITDMIQKGVWLNILSIILISLFVYFVLPLIWGFDLHHFPVNFSQ